LLIVRGKLVAIPIWVAAISFAFFQAEEFTMQCR
jgi:hypothetical protein